VSIHRRLFHKGLLGGQDTEVSICQRVHHPWVVAKRLHTSGVEGAVGMLTTSKKVFALLADMGQQPKCESIAGRRNHTVLRLETYDFNHSPFSKQSFAN